MICLAAFGIELGFLLRSHIMRVKMTQNWLDSWIRKELMIVIIEFVESDIEKRV